MPRVPAGAPRFFHDTEVLGHRSTFLDSDCGLLKRNICTCILAKTRTKFLEILFLLYRKNLFKMNQKYFRP